MDFKNIFLINASCIFNTLDWANHFNFLSKCLVELQEPEAGNMLQFCNFTGCFYERSLKLSLERI